MFHTRIRQAGAAQAARAAPGLGGEIEWSPEASPGPPRRKHPPARAGGRRGVSYSRRGVLERTRGCSACARSGAAPGCRMAIENGADVLHIGGHGTLTCGCAPSRPIRRTALEGGSQASHSVARSAASTVSTRAIHLRIMAALRSGSLSALPASGGPVWHARTRMHAHARTHAHTGAHARARARTRASSCAHTHRAVRRLAPATFEDQIPL